MLKIKEYKGKLTKGCVSSQCQDLLPPKSLQEDTKFSFGDTCGGARAIPDSQENLIKMEHPKLTNTVVMIAVLPLHVVVWAW